MVTDLRRESSRMLVALIERGVEQCVFRTRSPPLAADAVLQIGTGVSMWYRPEADLTEDDIVFQSGDSALGVVGAAPAIAEPRRARRR